MVPAERGALFRVTVGKLKLQTWFGGRAAPGEAWEPRRFTGAPPRSSLSSGVSSGVAVLGGSGRGLPRSELDEGWEGDSEAGESGALKASRASDNVPGAARSFGGVGALPPRVELSCEAKAFCAHKPKREAVPLQHWGAEPSPLCRHHTGSATAPPDFCRPRLVAGPGPGGALGSLAALPWVLPGAVRTLPHLQHPDTSSGMWGPSSSRGGGGGGGRAHVCSGSSRSRPRVPSESEGTALTYLARGSREV